MECPLHGVMQVIGGVSLLSLLNLSASVGKFVLVMASWTIRFEYWVSTVLDRTCIHSAEERKFYH